jgi:torulene dioxygenase
VSTTDGNALQQIDPVTLEPIELFDYAAYDPLLVSGGRSATHPVTAFGDALYNYVLDTKAEPPVYRVFGIDSDSRSTILANITDAPPAYIHALFGDDKHIVLIVWQADLVKPARSILGAIGPWNPERKALFYVIDRVKGGVVSKYVAPDAFFAFHEVNTFEDPVNGDILIDMPKMNDTTFLTAANMENLRANVGNARNGSSKNDLSGAFTRYRLPNPATSGPVRFDNGTFIPKPASIDMQLPWADANLELPRINPAYMGKPYRYAWGIHTAKVGNFADSVIKFDLTSKTWKKWTPSTPHLPSEPIFVPRPNATREDDGVLLTVAMDARAKRSSMVVIDAVTMKELGRARMPIVMGYGFHGSWGGN